MQKHHYQVIVAILGLVAFLLLLFKEQLEYGFEGAMVLIVLVGYLSWKHDLTFKSFVSNKPLSRALGYVTLGAAVLAMYWEKQLDWMPDQLSFLLILLGAGLIVSTFDSPRRGKWRL